MMRTILKAGAVVCTACFVLLMLVCCSRNPKQSAQTTDADSTGNTVQQGKNEMSDENSADVELDIDSASEDQGTDGKKETKPAETKPEETKPEETKPEETKPKETRPEETKPEETKPKETGNGGLELPMIPG